MQQLCSKFKNVNAHFWQSRMFIVRSKTWQNIIFFLDCWSCYKQRIHNVYLSKKQPSLKPSFESWLWHLDHVGGGGKTSWNLWAKYVCFDENGSGSLWSSWAKYVHLHDVSGHETGSKLWLEHCAFVIDGTKLVADEM